MASSLRERLEAAVLERHCANHPLTEKWAAGTLSRNAMAGWAIEHFWLHAEVDTEHGGRGFETLERYCTTPELQQMAVDYARESASVVSHVNVDKDAQDFSLSARRDDEQWRSPREEEQRSRRRKRPADLSTFTWDTTLGCAGSSSTASTSTTRWATNCAERAFLSRAPR